MKCELCVLLFFTKHAFKAHPCYSMNTTSIPFYGYIVFHCMDIPHFVYTLFDRLGFYLLAFKTNDMNIHSQVFISVCVHFLSEWDCSSCLTFSCLTWFFINILRNCFPNSCSHQQLQNHQQHKRLPFLLFDSQWEEAFHCGFDLHFPDD